MNYTLPNSLSTDLYKLRKEDLLSGKYIGAPIASQPIKEYDVYGRLKIANNLSQHKGGYNNFFGYKHPQTEPPNWWAPCFDDKQIRMITREF